MRRPLTLTFALTLITLCALAGCGTQPTNPFARFAFLTPASPLAPDGLTYTERYKCSQAFTGMPAFCADADVSDDIQFTQTGPSSYTARDVPDTGYLYTGTVSGRVLTWTATSPNGYSESGTWTFSADGSTFTGTSHYLANDNSYAGDCAETGARTPATPAPPPAIGACP